MTDFGNISGSARASRRMSRVLGVGTVVARYFYWLGTPGPQAQEDPGSFDVRSASVALEDGVYSLDAWVEYRLSTEAREALDAGVALTIHLDVEFLDPQVVLG